MDQQPTDIHGKAYNRNLLVLVLIIGSFCTVLNGTLLATALPSIMRSFHISTATAEWLSTAFLLVNGVMIPVSAWLINRFGSRKMYLTAMSVFFIGTVTAAVAPNFGTLLTGRIIQGLGVGVTMPLLQNHHAFNLSLIKTRCCDGNSWYCYWSRTSYWSNLIWVDC